MSLTIPSLQLSQSSLQDYYDCPRRFQYKVLDSISWPASCSEPISKFEESTLLGNRFHLICQQFFSGINPELLQKTINHPVLVKMWKSFLPFGESLLEYKFLPERLLSIPLLNHKLIAKFDLLVYVNPERYLIIDWKTSPNKPPREILSKRLQTHLYPYIFSFAGVELFETDAIIPNFIEMQYWYPLHTKPEEVFPYSDKKHSSVKSELENLVNQINSALTKGTDFPLTEDSSTCLFCEFRSLCNRGVEAGTFEKLIFVEREDLRNVQFDLDQVSEIEF